jgi:Spy/CpxP family protein refolding chaperone
MKATKLAAIGSVALGALLSAGVAGAQDREPRGPRPGGPGGPPPMERMLDRLGLTDEQKAAVQAVHEKNQDTVRPLGDTARQAHEAFQKALDAESPDATKVGQLALGMKAAQKKFEAARKEEMDEIKAILTPEQRDKFEQVGQRGPGRPFRAPGGPPRPDGPPELN